MTRRGPLVAGTAVGIVAALLSYAQVPPVQPAAAPRAGMGDAVWIAIIGLAAAVIGNIFALIQARVTARKVEENTALTRETAAKVLANDAKLDGRLTELIRASNAEALAKGNLEGRAAGVLEGAAIAQARADGRSEGMDTMPREKPVAAPSSPKVAGDVIAKIVVPGEVGRQK